MNRTYTPLLVLLLLCLHLIQRVEGAESQLVKPMADGSLVMLPWNEQGDRIPDFSFCGYRNGGVKLPDVPTLVTLEPSGAEDESARIQAALDDLGKSLEQTPDARGALLLKKGFWKIKKMLTMSYSGVVLRGEGDGADGTVLLWNENEVWVPLMLTVAANGWPSGNTIQVGELDQPYVPVGATRFRVTADAGRDAQTLGLNAGDSVTIFRPASPQWVTDIGMDIYNWDEWTNKWSFQRKVISCENGELVFDIPLPQSLDQNYGGAVIQLTPPQNRIRECGIERIRFDTIFDPSIVQNEGTVNEYPSDERHPGTAISFSKIEDAWLRDCTAIHMTHGLVNLGGCRMTVQDCKSLDPVSLIGGSRRYGYVLGGTSNLIQRCYSRNGRHDYMTQGGVLGPNAVVDCSAESAWDASENHQKWAMGTLFDNVRVNGTGPYLGLVSANRGRWGNGHGWSGNTTVFWNCASPVIFALQPPLGQNFMIGCSDPTLFDPVRAQSLISNQNNASGRNDQLVVGEPLQGTAWKEYPRESVTPRFLYYAQLQARLGTEAVRNVTTADDTITPDPEIAVEQPVGTNLVDGSASISCGSANLGSSSSPVTFSVKNTGTSDLTGLALTKDGTHNADFTLGSLGSATLAPNASTTFTVTFTPGAAGTKNAAIHIASNDANENPFDISLTGSGIGPGTLEVTPAGGLASSGNFGGPFSPSTLQYTLNNPGNSSIDWTAAKTAAWLTLDATGGTLAAGASSTVTASINAGANSMGIGSYNDTVTFTNTTSGSGDTTRPVSLTVNPILSYQGNGNTIGTVPAAQTKLHDVNLTVANNSGNLNKTDCSFAGWNTEADGSGTAYAAGGTYGGNASMTLYAQWVPGDDGTWIQTAAGPFDWGTSANWNNGTVAAGADRTANFTPNLAANQTINLESARTIGNINFTDSTTASHDLTISGANILTLARTSGTPTINVTNRALTISSVIVGSNGLMKSGAGTLVFNSGSNNSGTTTISAGTLQLGNGGTTGSLSTTSAIVNNGTFSITRSNAVTQGTDFSAAAITGSGNFTQRGTGTTTLNAANTYSGVTTISTGVLAFATAADGGVASSLGQSSNAAANLVIGGGAAAATLRYTGTGGSTDRLFTLTSPTFAHILDASGTGAINFTNTGAIAYGTNNAVRTLQLNGSNTGNNTLAALIQDNGTGKVSINKDWNGGAGTWVITGNNTYTGNTYLGNGTVIVTSLKNIGTASNLGAGGTIAFGLYNPAGTLKYEGTGDETNRAIDFSASGGFSTMVIDQSGTGLLKFTGTFVSSGVRDGKIVQLQGSTAGTGEMQSILVDNSPTNRTNVSKAGTGTWTLSGANTYVGNTTVSVGVLKLGNVNGLGFGGVQLTSTGTSTVTSGATLDLDGRSNVSEPITLNGDGVSSNGALVNNSATAASIGNGIAGLAVAAAGSGSGYSTAPTVVISGTGSGATATASLGLTTASIVTATGGTGWVTGDKVNITGGGGTGAIGTVTASAGAITSITITTPGTGYTTAPTGMTKNTSTAGAGTLTLTGNATNFTVSALAMTNAGSGYTGTPTFTFDGTAATVTPTLSSVALATNSSIGGTGDITINAVVSSSTRALTKVGAGTLTLAGANTSTGATTVSAGTLAVTGSLGATAVSVNAGTLSGNGNIGGSVSIASGATHSLAVAATTGAQLTRAITGTLTLTAGNILNLTAAATPAAGVYVLATATTAITGTPTTINYNGITGTVSVDTVSSPKRLLLTVTAGTLEVTPAGGLASSGNFGGPFSPSTLQYTLNNPGNSSIDWTAAKTAAWLTLDATGGTLAAGASATVTASINAGANSLGIGSYNDTVTFTNTTSGTGDTTRPVSLTVNPIPATVNLSNLLQTHDGFAKPVTVTTTPSNLAHSVTYNGSSTVPTAGGTYAVVATITEPNHAGSASGNLVISYAVSYQGNGNTNGTAPSNQTKFHDVALTLANNSGNLNKTDYSFAGWNTAADGSGTAYPAAGTYIGNASLTLYAQWVPGADGTWIQTAAGPFDWGTSANWNNGTVAAGPDRTANFTPNFAANQTINLESARTIGNITFTDSTTASNDLTISGANILTLARTSGTPTINVTNRALTISSVIAGSNGLMKSGAGTLVFNSGSNNSGTTTISAGTLQLGNGGTTGSLSTSSAIVNNGTFTIARSNAVVQGTDFSGAAISGTGGFTQQGGTTGTTTLNAANTYTGVTTISTGALAFATAANGSLASNLGQSSNAAANLLIGGGAAAATLRYTGTGGSTDRLFTLTSTFAGVLDASGTGAVNFTNTGAIAYGTVDQTRTLQLNGSNTGNNTLAALIGDNGTGKVSINKDWNGGAGTWVITGNNTYTGNTYLGNGTVIVTSLKNIGTASNLGAGGTIAFGLYNPAGTLKYEGTGDETNRAIDFSAAGGSSTMVIDQSGTGLLKFTGTFTSSGASDGKTVQLRGSTAGTGEMASILVDNRPTNRTNVSKAGTGTWTLSGANTYVGNTTVSVGVLKLGNVNGLGFGGVQLTSTGTSTVTSGATLDLDGRSNVSEPITLNGDGVSSNGALVNNSATAASIGNGIAGLAVAAAGSGSGYSTAPTVVISGTGSGATATASLGVTASSFTISGGTTIYSVAPTVTISGGTGATATAVLTGGVVSSITITNAGTGFTSAPTIAFSAGTVTTAGTNPTGSGNASNFTVGGLRVTNAGSGYTGTPTFTFNGTAATVTPTLSSVALGANSSVGGTGDITINAVVSGSTRALTKVGAGTLTLTGANTYTGATTVSAGTLAVTGSLAATAVSVANTATLSGNGNIGGNVSIAADATHSLAVAATTGAQLTRAITGTLTLTAGNILNLTAAATPAAGVYVLATATTAITGTPTTINYNGITGTVSVDTVSSPKRLLLTVTAGTPYDTWANGTFANAFTDKLPGSNPDGDTLTNLQEFAFGTDPTVSSGGSITWSGAAVTGHGTPVVIEESGIYYAVYGRRVSYVADGLTYTRQFSPRLSVWGNFATAPTVIATDGTIEAVKVPFPGLFDYGSGLEEAKFFRLEVSQ